MNIMLVVVRAFGRHVRGDVIDEPTEIARVLAGENAMQVVRVLATAKEA